MTNEELFEHMQRQSGYIQQQFEYLQQQFGAINKRLDDHIKESRKQHLDILGTIADFGGQLRDAENEHAVLSHQVSAREDWIESVVTAVKVRPEY